MLLLRKYPELMTMMIAIKIGTGLREEQGDEGEDESIFCTPLILWVLLKGVAS